MSGSMLPHGIVGISPLRCEPLKEGMKYTEEGASPKMWSDPACNRNEELAGY